MLKLIKSYRKDYIGEDVISSSTMENGQWNYKTIHVANNITNNQTSNRAVVFANGRGRENFNPNLVIKHYSGLLGANTPQTYGCNAFHRTHTPNFLIVTDRRIAEEVIASEYYKNNIVYTRLDIMLDFPQKFYLLPLDVYADAGTSALYLAAFDGHKRIYMIGFDGQDTPGWNNNLYAGTNGYDPVKSTVLDNKWIESQLIVMQTYDDVDFVFVSESGRQRIPESWKYCTNLRQISYRQMVFEADL